jgi:hypothetical protein
METGFVVEGVEGIRFRRKESGFGYDGILYGMVG